MPEYCTCGAKVVEDARFCHKCGRPLRDEPLIPAEEPPPLPEIPAVVERPPIGFGNPLAVWVALRVAVAASVLSLITGAFAPPLVIVWFVGAGFLAVHLYRLRTGESITTTSGARLGWLAGIFVFVLATVLFTIEEVMLMNPETARAMMEEFRKANPAVDPQLAINILRSPGGIAMVLVLMFMVLTLLPALGGWLGARFLQNNRGPADQSNP